MCQTLQNKPTGMKPQWDKNLTNSRTKTVNGYTQLTYLGEMIAHLRQITFRRNVYGSAIRTRKQKQKLETTQKTATAEKVVKLQHFHFLPAIPGNLPHFP